MNIIKTYINHYQIIMLMNKSYNIQYLYKLHFLILYYIYYYLYIHIIKFKYMVLNYKILINNHY